MDMSTTLGIDINALIQPLMIRAVLKGEEIPIDVIVDIQMTQTIYQSLMAGITLPSEFADLQSVIDLMIQMDSVKRLMAVLRGETPPEPAIDKIIELVVNLQLVSSLSQSLGGTAT